MRAGTAIGRGEASRVRIRPVLTALTLLVTSAGGLLSASQATDVPPVAVSTYRMPNGWLLTPAGHQVLTMKAPTGVAVSPDGSTVGVVTSGLADEDLVTVDAATLMPSLTPVNSTFLGVALDGDGNVYVSGGSSDRVYPFHTVADAAAVPTAPVSPLPGAPVGGIPAADYPGGMALARDGRLFVTGTMSSPSTDCAGGPVCSRVTVLDTHRRPPVAESTFRVGRDAFGAALNPAAPRLYVTNWADATVSVVDIAKPGSEHVVATIPVGSQPTGIAVSPDGRYAAVAGSDDDSITVLSLDDAGDVTSTRTLSVRVTSSLPVGSEPMAVGYGPHGLLYVAEAGINAVEVRRPDGRPISQRVTVDGAAARVPHTWIPTGWFPDALALSGQRLYVANDKGMGSGPGVYEDVEPLTGVRTEGTLSAIDLPAGGGHDPAYRDWTATVVRDDDFTPLFTRAPDPAIDPCLGAAQPDGTVVHSRLLCDASAGAIDPRSLHVVYVVNENKTFDSYFGDIGPSLPGADADPTYAQYGEPVTPNQHAIAESWNVSDNFWSEGDVSSEGHQWISAGYETPHDQLLWGPAYDEGLRGDRGAGQYDGQLQGGSKDASAAAVERGLESPRRRIFDQIADPATNPLGVTQRIYSDDVDPAAPAAADQVPLSLWGLGPHAVSGKDVTFPDVDRTQMFLHGATVSHAWNALSGPPPSTYGQTISMTPQDKAKFTLDGWTASYEQCRSAGGSDDSCQRAMPNFLYMVFPENHTFVIDDGYNPLDPTPQSMVADNDEAMGRLVAGLSRSPFWRNTLFVLTEDDVQYVGDHVDLHRDFLLAAGGLARRLGPSGEAAHQASSFPSVLKTVETLFDLPPLTLFDARAVPLDDVVADRPGDGDVPFTATRPLTPFLGDGGPSG